MSLHPPTPEVFTCLQHLDRVNGQDEKGGMRNAGQYCIYHQAEGTSRARRIILPVPRHQRRTAASGVVLPMAAVVQSPLRHRGAPCMARPAVCRDARDTPRHRGVSVPKHPGTRRVTVVAPARRRCGHPALNPWRIGTAFIALMGDAIVPRHRIQVRSLQDTRCHTPALRTVFRQSALAHPAHHGEITRAGLTTIVVKRHRVTGLQV